MNNERLVASPSDVASSRQAAVEVSIVIPCLDEARTIGGCIEEAFMGLEHSGVAGEVIVADNGSIDGSPEIARSHGAHVVSIPAKGYGAAIRGGISVARGRLLIIGDADGSHDLSGLLPFIVRLNQGDDLVVGNRFSGGIQPNSMPWLHRYVGNPFLSAVLNLLYRTSIHDSQCGFRALRRAAYERLFLNTPGMEFASELIIQARLNDLKISEVPTVHRPDGRGRESHLRTFRDGWRHLRLLLLLCPFWLYLLPSGFLLILGAGLMLRVSFTLRDPIHDSSDFWIMLLGVLFLITGYQTLWLWAYSKIHGWTSGLLPADTFSNEVFRIVRLESGLSLGACFIIVGVFCCARVVGIISSVEVNALATQTVFRWGLWGFSFVVVGVQTIYGSFFLSMLGLARSQRPVAAR
jgi:glycosyltransferase involved in cell wall biosynthesis